MKDNNYLNLAHIAGEIWGTMARAMINQPYPPTTTGVEQEQPQRILNYNVYFEILKQLKEDFKREVTVETEAEHGEDD